MSKLAYLQQKKLNPADELRALLNSLEDRGPTLKAMDSTKALMLLRDLDQVNDLFSQLEATDLNLLSEESRFQAVQSHLKKNVAVILKTLGGPEVLNEFRPSPPPAREQWWWYSHELVTVQRQRLVKQTAIGVLIAMVILGVTTIVFNTILAPSPEAVARVEAENEAIDAFEAGDYELAMAELEEGLAVVPEDPDLLVIKGVFLEVLGDDKAAVLSLETARKNMDDPAAFHLALGQIYFRTGQYTKAENEIRSSLDLNDDISAAWLLLGQSLEGQGRAVEAAAVYQRAGDIALANGDSEIVVLARIALSRVGVNP